jgi:iron complex transport system ATP-binding protein
MKLTVERVTMAYNGRAVVDGVSFEALPGEILGIVGPNGSGKSTLLRGMARLQSLVGGRVLLGETDIRALSTRAVARQLAILPQQPGPAPDLTVRELAWRGRHPHQGVILQRASPEDAAAVTWALDAADVAELAGRRVEQLSGGERQRAWLALALAQRPRVLLLDEPTSFLDLEHQVQAVRLLRRLAGEGLTVVAVLHDLVLAARLCDRVVALRQGRLEFAGAPAETFTEEALERVFNVPMTLLLDPVTGRPLPVPRSESPSDDGAQPSDE